MADAGGPALDAAESLRFFDERVRWQVSQFTGALQDVEVRACGVALARALGRSMPCVP